MEPQPVGQVRALFFKWRMYLFSILGILIAGEFDVHAYCSL
jgi:hypothetical protein